jgi:hypothetical protein
MSKKITEVADKPRSKTELKKAIPPDGIRCIYTDLAGRQCRGLALRPKGSGASRTKSGYCLAHATELRQLRDVEAVADELITNTTTLDSPVSVNRVLDKLFELTANDRIPLRKAELLTYQASLLLNSASGVRTQFLDGFGQDAMYKMARYAIRRAYGFDEADPEPAPKPGSDSEQPSEPNPGAEQVTQ